jgi:uncharacterized heparinase superfamily protein
MINSDNKDLGGLLQKLTKSISLARFNPLSALNQKPKFLFGTPPEIITGKIEIGHSILSGKFVLNGQKKTFSNFSDLNDFNNEYWLSHIYNFSWLKDLRMVSNIPARNLAREYIENWISLENKTSKISWRADILGERLTNWLTHFGFYSNNAPQKFFDQLFLSISRQAKYLNRQAMRSVEGSSRITALKGLIYCGVALPGFDKYLNRGQQYLETELNHQVFPDGGHYSRNPRIHTEVLFNIVSIRETLITAHIEVPDWLSNKIDKMLAMLKTFRHSDGGLSYFNGSTFGNNEIINSLLLKSTSKVRAVSSAPHSGFHKLSANKTTILMDTGAPPTESANKWGHAGSLSFEMTSGKDRIIVNCGSAEGATKAWKHALRSTAAHSTIIVNDSNSTKINLDGGYLQSPGQVTSSRREIDGSSIIEASYDGYLSSFDLIHRRLLMLAPDGEEIHGEDNIIGSGDKRYTMRFHLHPNIQATILPSKNSVLLKPRKGQGWRFECLDRKLALEESVYFTEDNIRRRTLQITIFGQVTDGGVCIKWRFSKI